jgi:hypothetical protein
MKLNSTQEKWLREIDVEYYIEKDGLEIYGDLVSKNFPASACIPIPVKIKRITGALDFERASFLTSLKNFPDEADYFVNFEDCKNLKTLEGGPKIVGSWYRLHKCESLENLDGLPEKISKIQDFIISDCPHVPRWMLELVDERNFGKISHEEFVKTYYKFREKPSLVQAKNLGLF